MNCYDFALTDNKLIKIKQLIENKSLNWFINIFSQ